jgi:methyl-accepting chemotaxis protein
MADATISTKIKLDGEAEYKQRISEINAALGTLDSKIKLLNTTYAGNENSIKGLTEINEVLNQKILTQRDKVEQLQEMLQKSAAAYGEADTTTQKYQQQLNNAEATLVKMEKTLAENTAKLQEAGGTADNFSDGLKDLSERTGETEKALVDAKKEAGNLGSVVDGLVHRFGIRLPDSLKTTLNQMGHVDATSIALAGTLAGVAAAIVKVEKAMISMTKEAASNADNLLTLASVTGMTTDSVQELNYMADLTDVSFDRIKDSLKETTNKMQEAAAGTGDAYDAYQRLGVSITNADGSLRSAQDVFYDTIDALGEIKNQTERDALAMDLMSESAQELNPLIDLGSEKMRDYAQEAHDMGYVLENDALRALQGVDDAYARMQNAQQAAKDQLAADFAPYLNRFYRSVTEGVSELGHAVRDSGIVDAAGMLLDTLSEIIAPMEDLSSSRVPALTRALRPLSELVASLADATDLISGLLTLNFDKVGTALGLNYSKGQMSNVQRLNTKWMQTDTNAETIANGYGTYFDTTTGKGYGSLESYAREQYNNLAAAGDSSILGMSAEVWIQQYMNKLKSKQLRGNAAGTDNWSGGWTRVNENGLERIYLPSGSRIQTASETRYTSGDTYNTTVYVDHVEDLDTILRIAKNARITTRMGAK